MAACEWCGSGREVAKCQFCGGQVCDSCDARYHERCGEREEQQDEAWPPRIREVPLPPPREPQPVANAFRAFVAHAGNQWGGRFEGAVVDVQLDAPEPAPPEPQEPLDDPEPVELLDHDLEEWDDDIEW